MLRHGLIAAAVLMTAGCADTTAGPVAAAASAQESGSWRADLKAAREALRAADRAHSEAADAHGFVDGLTSAFTDDVYFLRESAGVLQGREQVRAYLASTPLATARINWSAIRADVSADGTRGYTYGAGIYTRANGTTLHSRTISFWRNEGGVWKVAAMVVNLDPNPARPAPEGFFPPDNNGVRGAPASQGVAELGAIMQADRDFAALSAESGPAVAFRDFIAPDGAVQGGPLYGPEEIYNAFAGSRGRLDWGPILGEMAPSGDLGFTIGLAVSTAPTGAQSYSKYLTVWQRQPNGDWRYVVDGGNGRPAPAP